MWKDSPCLGVERLNTVKMSVVPYLIYGFNTIPTKIPTKYFTDIDKLILKFIQRGKKTQDSQHNTEEQSWRNDATNFKTLSN